MIEVFWYLILNDFLNNLTFPKYQVSLLRCCSVPDQARGERLNWIHLRREIVDRVRG